MLKKIIFKKVELWILFLVVLFGLPISLTFGVLVRQELEGITKKGNIDISALSKPATYIARIPEKFIFLIFRPNAMRVDSFWNKSLIFNQKI